MTRYTQTHQQSLTENVPMFTSEISMFDGALRSIFTQYSIQYSGHGPFFHIDPNCSDMLRCVLVQKSSSTERGNGTELL